MRHFIACLLGVSLSMAIGTARAEFSFVIADTILSPNAKFIAIGDVTGDDRSDIATIVEDEVLVYERLSTGQYAAPRNYRYTGTGWADYASDLALADLNHDGIKDIVVGGAGTLDLVVLKSNRLQPMAFTVEILANVNYRNGRDLVVTDIDGDTLDDVIQVIYSDNSSSVRLWPGNRSHGGSVGRLFRAPYYLRSDVMGFMRATVQDMDGDGHQDLVVSSIRENKLSIYYHDGVRSYLPAPSTYLYSECCNATSGDFNSDGLGDVVSWEGGNSPTTISVQLQQQPGQFAPPVLLSTFDLPALVRAEDMDGDGDDDLLVLHQGDGIGLYLQEQGILQPETMYGFYGGEVFAVGDLNSDGCKDVVYAARDLGLLLYHGGGCRIPPFQDPDLSVALAGSASAVSVGLANAPGTESIESPIVLLDLSVSSGTLQAGTLPANCMLQTQATRSVRIECLTATLAPEETASLTVPLTVETSGMRDSLTISASASSESRERSLANNRAWKQTAIRPTAKHQVMKRPAAAKPRQPLER